MVLVTFQIMNLNIIEIAIPVQLCMKIYSMCIYKFNQSVKVILLININGYPLPTATFVITLIEENGSC